MGLVLRLIVNAVALLVAAWIVPGITLGAAQGQPTANEWLTLLLVALIFGLVNAIIRPVVVFLTFPITVLTLGLFIFVINALMLILTSWIAA
ncbi:MAG TPA: phage holin family protein, partial [Candidatus Limnocylindrales bacterium]|nr:phage holin family protein [Candidatus Limnocylindrales bacterium]